MRPLRPKNGLRNVASPDAIWGRSAVNADSPQEPLIQPRLSNRHIEFCWSVANPKRPRMDGTKPRPQPRKPPQTSIHKLLMKNQLPLPRNGESVNLVSMNDLELAISLKKRFRPNLLGLFDATGNRLMSHGYGCRTSGRLISSFQRFLGIRHG